MSVSTTWRLGYTDHPTLPIAVFEPTRRRTQIPLLFLPGLAGGADDPFPLLEFLNAVDTGIVGVCANLSATGNGWGNDAERDAVVDVVAWTAANYGTRTDKVALMAESMGGLTALNYAAAHLEQIAAVALAIPAINLQDIHDRDVIPGIATSIETAYGGLAGYLAALPTHNPAVNAAAVAPIVHLTKAWYSQTDAICLPAETEAWSAANGVEIIDFGPEGHTNPTDAGYFQELVDHVAPLCWWG